MIFSISKAIVPFSLVIKNFLSINLIKSAKKNKLNIARIISPAKINSLKFINFRVLPIRIKIIPN